MENQQFPASLSLDGADFDDAQNAMDRDESDEKRQPDVKPQCDICRQAKLRCDVVQEPFQSCSRCERLALDCSTTRIGKSSKQAKTETQIQHLRRNISRAPTQDYMPDESAYGPGEQEKSRLRNGPGDILKALDPKEASEMRRYTSKGGTVVKVDKNEGQVEPQGSGTDQDATTTALPQPLAQVKPNHGYSDLSLRKDPALHDMDTVSKNTHQVMCEQGVNPDRNIDGQPVPIDQSLPTLHCFRQQILHLNPFMRSKNYYLVERLAYHQLLRLRHLVDYRTQHSTLEKACPSGSLCLANGGSAITDGKIALKEAGEDEEVNALGVPIAPEHFPPGIPTPPTTRFPAQFECRLCCRPWKFSKPSDWRKHVQEDVMPFSCTREGCSINGMFKRKKEWVRHETEAHCPRERWTCDADGCWQICFSQTTFAQHLVKKHRLPEPKDKSRAPARTHGAKDPFWEKVEACHHVPSFHPEDEPCRFCGRTFRTRKKWTVHLAKHMEQIALPILQLVERVADDPGLTFVPSQGFLPIHRQVSARLPYSAATITEDTSTRNKENESRSHGNEEEAISTRFMPIPRGDCQVGEDPADDNPQSDPLVNSSIVVGDHLLRRLNPELPTAKKKQDSVTVEHSTDQTDSGYASLPRTVDKKRDLNTDPQAAQLDQTNNAPDFDDAATEYTNADSVGTLMKNSYISGFVEDLSAKILDFRPGPDEVERISEVLPHLLQASALRLGFQEEAEPAGWHVWYFVYKYRSYITKTFKDRAQREEKHPVDPSSTTCARMPQEDWMDYQKERTEAKALALEDDSIPLNELMASWFEGLGEGQDDGLLQPQEPASNDTADSAASMGDFERREMKSTSPARSEGIVDDDSTSIIGYRSLVLETDAFKWLLARLRSEMRLVSTEPKAMEAIGSKIVSSLRAPGRFSRTAIPKDLKATFELYWDVRDFFEQQQYNVQASEALPKVITLTGSDKDAQALTCAEYLSQTWPLTGSNMLSLVQKVLDSGDGAPSACQLPDGTRVSAWTWGQRFVAEAQGNAFSVAEVGEQIAWLATALRSPSVDGAIVCCYPFISEIRMAVNPTEASSQAPATATARTYKFGFHFDETRTSAYQTNGQCWHDMFISAVVVKGYPILARSEAGTGMEVPLNIMAGLARADWLDQFGEATFVKGFSSLYPNGRRISYLHNVSSHLGLVTTLDLGNFRHILGWCAEAEFYAGSAQANYLVGASGLPRPQENGALAGLFVSPGRGIVGGSAFILGQKDTPAHVARNGYIPKLQWISTKFVLLWDVTDRRGWLINGTSALLHIVRSSLAHNGVDKFKAAFMFQPQDIQESGTPGTVESAIDVLINPANLALKLYQEKDGHLLLQSRIDHYYNILEKLIDHQADIAGEDGSKLADHPRRYLEGWDFRDLATSRDPLYPRVTTLSGEGKAWVDLIRAVHAVTLLGRGFGELIRSRGADTCDFWADLPKGKSYIAAGLCDLIQVTDNNNLYNDGHVRLSQGIIWHTPTAIFGSCRCRGILRADHCEPVQSVLPSSMSNILLPRRLLIPKESSGAVIFGQHSGFPWIWKDHGAPQENYSPMSFRVSETTSSLDSDIRTSIMSSPNANAATAVSWSPATGLKQLSIPDTDAGSSNAASFADDFYSAVDYTVGILCALSKELLAVRALFDRKHGGLEHIAGDVNHYCLGQIGNHMVVAACLPMGDYGTTPAADSASNMNRSFPNIKFCLLVGIGGGVPSKEHDIRLGDVVVSAPTGLYPGVIQHDRGKDNEDRSFERTGFLRPPPGFLMTAINRMESNPDRPFNPLEPYLSRIQDRIRFPERMKYQHPGQDHDTFSQNECQTCQGEGKCSELSLFLKQRSKRPTNDPQIFYGLIASGNSVMKDAHVRNEWADKCGVLCFEMEAAGIMNIFPCLVIRGICDYADSSKNDVWQEYDAATASAYAKLLLEDLGTDAVSGGKSILLAKRPRGFAGDELPRKQQRV